MGFSELLSDCRDLDEPLRILNPKLRKNTFSAAPITLLTELTFALRVVPVDMPNWGPEPTFCTVCHLGRQVTLRQLAGEPLTLTISN